ncbi:hypothetical protein [Kitasatospora viridis]|uniref:SUKH superfamily protein n=1 Tax=Kitasatospora viridis TaxID=281105 RepID=A0A561TTA3_9ACTN|nr:hypothetical protein FHX73_13385 [Kitasatospora viridis]
MAADFYHAENENGARVDDPSEAAIRTLLSGLDNTENTFVIFQAGEDESSWYASVASEDGGGYEIVLRDPSCREHAVTTETSVEKIARDLVLWIARRDFRGRAGRRTAPRPDVAGLAHLAGLAPATVEPLLPWDLAQDVAGIQLPADYRAFVDLFGPGELRGELGIVTPRPLPGQPIGAGALSRKVNELINDIGAAFKQMREDLPDLCPYPVYPEPGGLLYWAGNYNGDYCFWLTEGADPDRWPVVVWLRGEFPDGWHRYDMGMARFLLLALSGEDAALDDLGLATSTAPVWVPSHDAETVQQ